MLSGSEFDGLGATALAKLVAAGVDWVQVRERERSGRALLALVEAVQRATGAGAERGGRRVRVLVNRRVDVALAAGADGVHLGFDGMSATEARRLLGADALVGVACHAAAEVAAAEGASHAHLAPIFDPLSKAASRPALGLDALATAAAHGLPVLAQGGISAGNAGACLAAGARGVAVTGTLLAANDPAAAAAALRAALDADVA